MNKPQYGKIYALTGTSEDKCIGNGNTWEESEVKNEKPIVIVSAAHISYEKFAKSTTKSITK